ncbi:hypothetical protein F5878DRAFT_646963 [Lentinula raphanica]|uniref:Uncharacterized protein n=1 Tax=Lentinula raphanica TaxID=153919 RepID=A0AA38NX35_9AGAR|nr:hypothetical protein F5878DRAFT_646963 [Lentinula raphanica]
MPRKKSQSAAEKYKLTAEEKQLAKAKSRQISNRRYRRKIMRNDPDKESISRAKRRSDMTEAERATAKEKQKQYNATYYLRHREDILHKSMKKRAKKFIEKHGESAFWNDYPHRNVGLRKSLGHGLLPK